MEFSFSEDQEQLRRSVRDFLGREVPMALVRRLADGEEEFPEAIWETLASLGWLGLLVPEGHGGLGLGMVDVVAVQEELGRALFPGPFLSSAIVGTLVLLRLGATELLGELASGTARATLALEEVGFGDPLGTVRTRARRDGRGYRLSGVKPLVLDGHTARYVVVVAREEDGTLGSFLVERPAAEPVPTLDVTRKAARLALDDTPASRLGPPGDHGAILRRVLDDAAVAVAAELVGVCDQALGEAVEYANARVQFDRPIARFQVIRHKAVDMLHRLELARVGAHYAAWASDAEDPEREAAAAMAKAFAAEAAVAVTGDDIQIHGGTGFTWEVDAHLYYRRAKQDDLLFGSQGWQRQRLADLVLGPVAAR